MLLLLLLALGAQNAGTPLLSVYHATAVDYETGDREKALREIRRWGRHEILSCIQALRGEGDRREKLLLPNGKVLAEVPLEIDFRTVEAATLMHVEAGLLELQALRVAKASSQLSAAALLVDWSHELRAKRLGERSSVLAKLRRSGAQLDPAVSDDLDRAFAIELKIDPRGFYVALGASALAVGFPEVALPFAEEAREAAPLDGEALLLSACVKESLAHEEDIGARQGRAGRLREEAEALLRAALAADPSPVEARLRLGRVLLTQGRPLEAEPVLRQAADQARERRQRYLALLFLGRTSELHESPDAAATFYRRALETWPDSQTARLALARCLEASAGPSAAHPLVMASLLDSTDPSREPDPWWSYPFGPQGLAKAAVERLWRGTLGRPFGS